MKRLPLIRAIALLALGNLACATTRVQKAESWPEAITASQLLHEHWDAPAGSDAQFRRNTSVIGVVSRRLEVPGRGTALDLQTDERKYFVRCWLASATPATSSGQLVAVRGIGSGVNNDAPELRNCAVTWSGGQPESRPVDAARDATITAASANLCALEATVRALSAAAVDPNVRSREDEKLARAKRLNRDLLAKSGGVARGCDHSLVTLVSQCRWLKFGLGLTSAPIAEGNRYFESENKTVIRPECEAAQVKDALDALSSDQFNPRPDPLPEGEGEGDKSEN